MIKTVLFDLGNVILPFDLSRLAGRLKMYSKLSVDEIIANLWNDEIANTFETGMMAPQEYFAHATRVCGFEGLSYEHFVPIFNDIFVEDQEVKDLIGRLGKKYRMGLISNINPIHVPYVIQTCDTLKAFERLWFSNIERVRKPDPAIYRLALDHFDVAPSEALFIDDMPVNIDSARKIGINGVVFKSAGLLKEELTKLGVTY